MSDISTETVQKLREMTGAGVMDCHRALKEANGDLDAAVAIIREKGLVKARSAPDAKRAQASSNRMSTTSASACF